MNLVGLFIYASASAIVIPGERVFPPCSVTAVALYFKFKFSATLYHIYLALPSCLRFIIIKYSTLVSAPTGHAATNAGSRQDNGHQLQLQLQRQRQGQLQPHVHNQDEGRNNVVNLFTAFLLSM